VQSWSRMSRPSTVCTVSAHHTDGRSRGQVDNDRERSLTAVRQDAVCITNLTNVSSGETLDAGTRKLQSQACFAPSTCAPPSTGATADRGCTARVAEHRAFQATVSEVLGQLVDLGLLRE